MSEYSKAARTAAVVAFVAWLAVFAVVVLKMDHRLFGGVLALVGVILSGVVHRALGIRAKR